MGQPAARLADPGLHVKGAGVILQGCASVRIEGRLAARQGDEIQHNQHVEVITTGEPTVRIGGKLAARTGDKLSCLGCVDMASPTVRIGRDPAEACLTDAHAAGDSIVTHVDAADD